MSAGAIYRSIAALIEELAHSGIPKSHKNIADDYEYRSIDDVLNKLSPLLAKHRICVLPRVRERTLIERAGPSQPSLFHVSIRAAFDLVSAEDGTRHRIETFGEALDPSDKATSKALSAAYKSAMVQAFCIPVAGNADADETTYGTGRVTHLSEPLQGWDQWCRDIVDIVAACETEQAVDFVQERNLAFLKTLRKERPDLYGELGSSFTERRNDLNEISVTRGASPNRKAAKKRRAKGTSQNRAKVDVE